MRTDGGLHRPRGGVRPPANAGGGPIRSRLLQAAVLLATGVFLGGALWGAPVTVQVVRDVVYASVPEGPLELDLYIPAHDEGERLPLVVWVHGGAWIAGDRSDPRAARELGDDYIVASIDYRLSGQASFPAQIFDCKAAVRWLRANADRYDIDPDRIGAWGASAGGHLAALLGTSGGVEALEGEVGGNLDCSSAVQAVCDFYGPTDLEKLAASSQTYPIAPSKNPVYLLFGGPLSEDPILVRQANPITHVGADDPPFLILHGDDDRVVPLEQSELLHAALREAGVEATLRVMAGYEHGGFPPEAYDEVRRFFDEHLKTAP